MLDLDDTVLKEVSLNYKNNNLVRNIIYNPGEKYLIKYKKRLQHPDPNKIIHYEFINDKTIRSYLIIRPSIIYLLDELDLYFQKNLVKLYITSANDFQRTDCIFNTFKIGNKTLKERKGILINPKQFITNNIKNLTFF